MKRDYVGQTGKNWKSSKYLIGLWPASTEYANKIVCRMHNTVWNSHSYPWHFNAKTEENVLCKGGDGEFDTMGSKNLSNLEHRVMVTLDQNFVLAQEFSLVESFGAFFAEVVYFVESCIMMKW